MADTASGQSTVFVVSHAEEGLRQDLDSATIQNQLTEEETAKILVRDQKADHATITSAQVNEQSEIKLLARVTSTDSKSSSVYQLLRILSSK